MDFDLSTILSIIATLLLSRAITEGARVFHGEIYAATLSPPRLWNVEGSVVVLTVNNGMQARKVIADSLHSFSLSLSLYRHAPLKGWRATFYRDKHRAYEARRPPSDTLLSRASLRLFLLLRIFTMRFHDRDLTAPVKTTFHISPLFSRALVRVSRGIYFPWKITCARSYYVRLRFVNDY